MLVGVQALSNDAAFVRVRKGVYALRALAGNVGPVPHNTPKSSRPPLGRGWDHRDSYRSVNSSHVCRHKADVLCHSFSVVLLLNDTYVWARSLPYDVKVDAVLQLCINVTLLLCSVTIHK